MRPDAKIKKAVQDALRPYIGKRMSRGDIVAIAERALSEIGALDVRVVCFADVGGTGSGLRLIDEAPEKAVRRMVGEKRGQVIRLDEWKAKRGKR